MASPTQISDRTTHQSDEIYEKTPLKSGSRTIRLLRFARDQNSSIIGSLSVHSLDDATVSWIALSYTWRSELNVSGNQTGTDGVIRQMTFRGMDEGFRAILIDGMPLNIGSNLWRALDALLDDREQSIVAVPDSSNAPLNDPTNQPRSKHIRPSIDCEYFWIDAICIDQGRSDEKTHQVPLMKDIFSGAKLVIGWLTPAGEDVVDSSAPVPADTMRCCARCDPFRDAILKNPYWRRMWIVQEIILAQDLVFLYRDIWITPEWIQKNSWNESLALIQDRMAFLDKRFMDFAYPTRYLRLSTLLGRYQHQQCADDRDKIYALLGLLPGTYPIRADYSKSVFQLAIEVVHIEASMSLEYAYPWWVESLVRALNFDHDKSMRDVLVELFSHAKLFDETHSSLRNAEQVARMMIDTVDGRAYLRHLKFDTKDPNILVGQLDVEKLMIRLDSRMIPDRYVLRD